VISNTSNKTLDKLTGRWKLHAIIFYLLISIVFSLLAGSLLHYFQNLPNWYIAVIFIVGFCACFLLLNLHKISQLETARFLNHEFTQLEDSAELLLSDYEHLNSLGKLQYMRVSERLQRIHFPEPFRNRISFGFLAFLLSAVLSILLLRLEPQRKFNEPEPQINFLINNRANPSVKSVEIGIRPPAYTGLAKRNQASMNLQVEENSVVSWQVLMSTGIDSLQLAFNDSTIGHAQPQNEDHSIWSFTERINTSGYYQLRINGRRSELYSIEVIKDKPPEIVIHAPAPYTVIEKQSAYSVNIQAGISDDYGIGQAFVQATIASGLGEAVKFRQKRIAFSGKVAVGSRKLELERKLDLTQLQMKPGDELFFYVIASDNQQHQSRSEMYIVSLPDTGQTSGFEGSLSAQLPIPEYFRSQRQIIIETEQLLKAKKSIDLKTFAERSNSLAVDQKILRLRYGKFLGEESEEKEGIKSGNDSAIQNPYDFGNQEKLLDRFTDKHDNAGDADFFEPETKKQLRNTLTEMWGAELKLRTADPLDALPFEYRALRMLKDLQQKTRAYAAKTGNRNAPPLLSPRLSADLSKISDPVIERKGQLVPDSVEKLRMALAVLNSLESRTNLSGGSLSLINEASKRLGQEAISNPKFFLAGYQSIIRIESILSENGTIDEKDVLIASLALQKLIPLPEPSLLLKQQAANQLARYYFENLEKAKAKP
jgi:Domain of unknown function (DUF4175)